MYEVFVSVSFPFALVTVSDTLYTPGVLYVIAGGVANVEVAGIPPEKDHEYEVGLYVDKLVNVTEAPAVTVVGIPEKSATGGRLNVADAQLTAACALIRPLPN